MQGTIRFYRADKGWGFIVGKNLKQVFFHISEWQNEETPIVGDRVEFSLGASKRDGYPDEAKRIERIHPSLSQNAESDIQLTVSDEAARILAGDGVSEGNR